MTAEVVKGVFTRTEDDPGGENWRGTLIENARQVSSFETSDTPLTAYIVLGIYKDGTHSIVHRYDPDRCPIPSRLLPAFVEELVREVVVTERAIDMAINSEEEEAK